MNDTPTSPNKRSIQAKAILLPLLLVVLLAGGAYYSFFSGDPLLKKYKENLIGLWYFEGNGQDASEYEHHGTLYGDVEFIEGPVGLAMKLDGIDDYILIPNSPRLNPTDAITLAGWYRAVDFQATGNTGFVDKGFFTHDPPFYQYHLGVTGTEYTLGGNIIFWLSLDGRTEDVRATGTERHQPTPTPHPKPREIIPHGSPDMPVDKEETVEGFSLRPDTWYHLAGTYDGSEMRLYIDGELVDIKKVTGRMTDYGQDLVLGSFSNLEGEILLPGAVDELLILDRALLQSEIQDLYLRGEP